MRLRDLVAAVAAPAAILGGCAGPPGQSPDNLDLEKIGGRSPEYPRAARAQGVEGGVALGFVVTPEGRVADIEVLIARPEEFGDPAVKAVSTWRYRPRRVDGVDVCTRVTILLGFCLDGPPRGSPRPVHCESAENSAALIERIKNSLPKYADINNCP